ncbi:HDOD domain-containing protein, partial [Acidithiobacillus thiooxidans]
MTAKELALLLSQRDIPLLGSTVNQILALTEEEDAKSITEIGALISRDPALAALILRMANSSFFNPGGTRIYTLSRALIVLGLQQMRTLCYSAVLLETTVKTQFQDQVFPLLKKSLEMAGQAQFLAQ